MALAPGASIAQGAPSLDGPGLVVVQCNPRPAADQAGSALGRLLAPILGRALSPAEQGTWESTRNLARWIARDCPEADVVGMQELPGEDCSGRVAGLLADETGRSWDGAFESQGRAGRASWLAVLWRTDRLELEERLGTVDVARLDDGYVVRFMGVLLRHRSSGRSCAVFSGKLVWGGAMIEGHRVTEEQRVEQARAVKNWIDRVMACRPGVSRVITMDENAGYWSPTFREMLNGYQPDGSDSPTFQSASGGVKLDCLWYGGPGRFVHPARVSERLGSDRRALWTTVRLVP